MPARTTSPTQDTEAYALRQRGFTYDEIAQSLSLTRQNAYHAVRRGLAVSGHVAETQRVRPYRARRTASGAVAAPTTNETLRADAEVAVTSALSIEARQFGIEIECRRPRGLREHDARVWAANLLVAAGIPAHAENYSVHEPTTWIVKYDGSSDLEVVSPPIHGAAGWAQVQTVMTTLRGAGCRVTASEGMHVHVDANDLSAEAILDVVEFYSNAHDLIDTLVSRNRRTSANGGRWCHRLSTRERSYLRGVVAESGSLRRVSIDRYRSVNLDAYRRQGTIEFRQHQGSLNGTKATRWVTFVTAIVECAHRGVLSSVPTDSLDALLDGLVATGALDAATAAGLSRRASALA